MDTSLKIIKQKLQNILNRLEWESETASNSSVTRLLGLSEIRLVLNDLESLHLFDDIVTSLKNSVIFTTKNDFMSIQNVEARNIDNQLSTLKTLVNNFLNILLRTVPEEDPNSINIKLPEVHNFDELSKVAREIHVGLTQVIVNEEINGQTKIVSVENGSIWLNVFVGTTAVAVVASLVWSAVVIYKKIQEGRLLEQQVRSLKVKNDSLEDILKAQKAETNLMIEAEAKHISSEHFNESKPENIERIKNSIKIFADLIEKGAEIHPALVAPENVTNLFPNPTNLIGIESKIKKLANSIEN